jgi:hypothetical protein
MHRRHPWKYSAVFTQAEAPAKNCNSALALAKTDFAWFSRAGRAGLRLPFTLYLSPFAFSYEPHHRYSLVLVIKNYYNIPGKYSRRPYDGNDGRAYL